MAASAIDIPTADDLTALSTDPASVAAYAEDLSQYTFAKYAATYFGASQTHQFSKRQLKTSLLQMQQPIDEIAAQVRKWMTIERCR